MDYFWKPMPYFIMRDCKFLKILERNKISQGISALKIFIYICLQAETDEDGVKSANITYDQFAKYCCLSRKLVSIGIQCLKKAGVIEVTGDRKKTYHLMNCVRVGVDYKQSRFLSENGYWCKLPYKGLVDENKRIPALEAMTNRNINELNALKVFLYLLMIRKGGELHVSVTLKKIKDKLSLSYREIVISVGYLQSLGLIVKANVGKNSISRYDDRFAIVFLVCGYEYLDWKPKYLSDEEWKQQIVDLFD